MKTAQQIPATSVTTIGMKGVPSFLANIKSLVAWSYISFAGATESDLRGIRVLLTAGFQERRIEDFVIRTSARMEIRESNPYLQPSGWFR